MLQSMTGFGTSSFRSKDLELEVSLKSLNGRFLDVRVHAPREYAFFESEIRSVVSQSLYRGTVDVYINRRFQGGRHLDVSVNERALKKWSKAFDKAEASLGRSGQWSLDTLMSLPELVEVKTQVAVSGREKGEILKLVAKAAMLCSKERRREGQALGKTLKSHLSHLAQQLSKMETYIEQANTELYNKFKSRIERVSFGEKVDSDRIAQEVAVFLDRCDVSEEIQRLREHLRNCLQLVSSRQSSEGKKLEFYTQELLREVNTIGSKSQIVELTELVVEAKSSIEKIKEQVQNVA